MSGTRFTSKELFERGYNIVDGKGAKIGKSTPVAPVKKKSSKNASIRAGGGSSMDGKSFIEFALIASKEKYEKEFMFVKGRKFRADYAIPDKRILVEYEGVYGDGISRHTHVSGYTNDARKYNMAVIGGWRVLRYTASSFKEIVGDLKELLK